MLSLSAPRRYTTNRLGRAHLAAQLHIVLAYSPAPRVVQEFAMHVAHGSTVAEAIAQWQASLPADSLALGVSKTRFGVWGKRVKSAQVLNAADRLEIYRPLKVDPKTARRERFAKQGTKGAGLFAKTRTGAKQGY